MINKKDLLKKMDEVVKELQAEQRALRGTRFLRMNSPKRAEISKLVQREIGVHIVREIVNGY
jgi:hypothetical protein